MPLTPTDNSRPIGAAPETFNSEQDDEAAQAQTVSDNAIRGIADRASAHESGHGGATNPAQIAPIMHRTSLTILTRWNAADGSTWTPIAVSVTMMTNQKH